MGAWNAALAVPGELCPQTLLLEVMGCTGMTQFKLASTLALSGWYLYTYNEFAFKVSSSLCRC